MKLAQYISEFMNFIAHEKVEIYNEFSLQHELGIFLRNTLPEYKVEFERHINHFNLNQRKFVKKEIDISITSRSNDKLLAIIELKYPRNGQVPEQMFSFCKDIQFVEQLVGSGFQYGVFLAVTDDPLFYSGKAEGIYGLFRGSCPIHGVIKKPTGAKNTEVNIMSKYLAKWQDVAGSTKYCLVEIVNDKVAGSSDGEEILHHIH